MLDPELLICSCSSAEHQMIIHRDDTDYEAFCEIYLCNYDSFWKRLWYGLKYAFGYKCKYGAFDEIILDYRHADKLIELGNFLKNGKH